MKALPDGWRSAIEPASGHDYFWNANINSGRSQWQDPRLGSKQATQCREESSPAQPTCSETLLVTARSLSGELLFGPEHLLRAQAAELLRAALLRSRALPSRVAIVHAGRALSESDSSFDVPEPEAREATVECTALFSLVELSSKEWVRHLVSLVDSQSLSVTEKRGAFAEAAEANILAAVEKTPRCLQFVPRETVLSVIQENPLMLLHAGAARDDHDLVAEGIEKNPLCFQYAGPRCRDDVKIASRAVELYPCCLDFVGPTCHQDTKLIAVATSARQRVAF